MKCNNVKEKYSLVAKEYFNIKRYK